MTVLDEVDFQMLMGYTVCIVCAYVLILYVLHVI